MLGNTCGNANRRSVWLAGYYVRNNGLSGLRELENSWAVFELMQWLRCFVISLLWWWKDWPP
jgi:hypothetical protein